MVSRSSSIVMYRVCMLFWRFIAGRDGPASIVVALDEFWEWWNGLWIERRCLAGVGT